MVCLGDKVGNIILEKIFDLSLAINTKVLVPPSSIAPNAFSAIILFTITDIIRM